MPKEPSKVRNRRSDNELFYWDFTLDAKTITKDGIIFWLREVGKQWVFQEEVGKGETAYHHFQGRVNLKKKTRFMPLPEGARGDQSFTKDDTVKGKRPWSYVMKSDTRVAGPWSDRDCGYVPSDVPDLNGLLPWQARCKDYLMSQNDRQILFLQDSAGRAGKSKLIRHLIAYEKAIYVPPICENSQQMGGYVYAAAQQDPTQKRVVVFDMPRAMGERAWRKAAPVIELVKDGYACDGRNTAKACMCEQPLVLVAFNNLPKDTSLSQWFTNDKIDVWSKFS